MGNATSVRDSCEGLDPLGVVNGISSTTNLVLPRDQRRFASKDVTKSIHLLSRSPLRGSSRLLAGIFFCDRSGCAPDTAAEMGLGRIAPRTGQLHTDQ